MQKTKKKNFDTYFENADLTKNDLYSLSVIKSIARSILEPIVANRARAIVFTRLKDVDCTSLTKRLEYCADVNLREFSDFEFSKFDVDEIGFIILNSQRYNCAFMYREVENLTLNLFLILIKL